jgi:aspartate/methionine/tyrosine aminotransferase
MFAPTRYLAWARRFYGTAPFDLASSGIPVVPHEELGAPPATDDVRGWDRARAAVARFNDVPKGEAILALGTTHALWLAYATLLSPGDEVLVEAPTYEPLVRIAEGVGARIATFDRPASSGYAVDPRRVADKMTDRTRVVAVSNLHNPSGARIPDDVLRETARIVAARGATLLVDEVYAPFDVLVGPDGVFASSARKLAPNIVAVSSLTKCFGLGNDRIGWLLASSDVIARADDTITASVGMLPLAHANLAVHAFERIPALADRTRRLLGDKRARVAAWMQSHPRLSWSAPDAGLFGFATLDDPADVTPLIEAGVASHGVLVAAGSFFGVPNGFRLGWSLHDQKLAQGLERLAAVLKI